MQLSLQSPLQVNQLRYSFVSLFGRCISFLVFSSYGSFFALSFSRWVAFFNEFNQLANHILEPVLSRQNLSKLAFLWILCIRKDQADRAQEKQWQLRKCQHLVL